MFICEWGIVGKPHMPTIWETHPVTSIRLGKLSQKEIRDHKDVFPQGEERQRQLARWEER
jgi:hypothetical protein